MAPSKNDLRFWLLVFFTALQAHGNEAAAGVRRIAKSKRRIL
jgi:hypothetical protein